MDFNIHKETKLTRGVHANKTFDYVFKNDPSYCEYMSIYKYNNPNLKLFKQFCIFQAKHDPRYINLEYINKSNDICIFGSEISALADRHKYKDHQESIIEHMKRENKFCSIAKRKAVKEKEIDEHNYNIWKEQIECQYPDIEIEKSLPTYEEEVRYLESKYPEIKIHIDKIEPVQIDVDSIAKSKISKNEYVNIKKEEVITDLEFDNVITPEETSKNINIIDNKTINCPQEIKLSIVEELPMLRGIKKENEIYQKLKDKGYDIREPQNAISTKFKIGDFIIKIYGKVDGIEYVNDAPAGIIEIKNRMNKFFDINPEYDLDQLAAYIICSNLEYGYIVQVYNGELKIDAYTKDELILRWINLLYSNKLYASLTHIYKLTSNPESPEAIKFAHDHLMNYDINGEYMNYLNYNVGD